MCKKEDNLQLILKIIQVKHFHIGKRKDFIMEQIPCKLLGVILNLSVTNARVESSFSIEKNVIRDNRSVLKISSVKVSMMK
jgi:hypothetical protein